MSTSNKKIPFKEWRRRLKISCRRRGLGPEWMDDNWDAYRENYKAGETPASVAVDIVDFCELAELYFGKRSHKA